MKKLILMALVLNVAISSGFSWSAPGHEAVAVSAMQMLQGTEAAKNVTKILDGDTAKDAAIWLDLVREHHNFDDDALNDEATQFRKDFPQNTEWHFCNFIVGSTSYDFSSKYSSNDDVVHALERAIAVLEGESSKMTKQQALRAVFHLVGDIHQPLHCITGFYDLSDMNHPVLLSDVDDPATAVQDRGGNQLYYTKSQELHALWDLKIPQTISKDTDDLASNIKTGNLASQPMTAGDYHHWAEAWAGESMVEANAAYAEIKKFNSAEYVDDPRHAGKKMLKIYITIPQSYKEDQEDRAQRQLSKAAMRLAQLLEKIRFN